MAAFILDLQTEALLGQLLPPQVVTANVTGPTLDASSGTSPYSIEINVGAVTGTAPTLAIQINDSPDQVVWTAVPDGALTGLVAGSADTITAPLVRQSTQRYVQAVLTVGGTSPSFTMAMTLIAQNHKGGTSTGYDTYPQNAY